MIFALIPSAPNNIHSNNNRATTLNTSLTHSTMSTTIDIAQRAMAQMENALKAGIREQNEALIRSLAEKHSFDADVEIAALTEASITRKAPKKAVVKAKTPKEQKPKRVVPQMPLPWTGESNDEWCQGIRLNGGLHSQCTNEQTADGTYCKTCQKGADANGTGKPVYGNVEDRKAVGVLEFRDSKGKQTVPMANLLEKSKHSRAEIEEEAAKFGMTIPEEHWVARVAKRGRPSKKSDGESSSDESAKRGPGRPKKQITVVEGAPTDDIISKLVADAVSDGASSDSAVSTDSSGDKRSQKARAKRIEKFTAEAAAANLEGDAATAYVTAKETAHTAKLAKSKAAKAAKAAKDTEKEVAAPPQQSQTVEEETQESVSSEEEEEEEAGVSVKPWTHPTTKVEYYKSTDGMVYKKEDHEVLGQWNEETQKIDEIEDED